MLETTFPILATSIPLMGSPGPATISLAAIGSAYGFRAGLPYLTGIILGTTGVLILVASGLLTLMMATPVIIGFLGIVGMAYILYLAWKIATAPVGMQQSRSRTSPSLVPGLFLALSNPKAFAAIGAAYASHSVVQGDLRMDAFFKVTTLTDVIITVNSCWLMFGVFFASAFSHPLLGRVMNVTMAAMLVATVAFALCAD
ncbi:threonine transporter RhtB [Tateyamaria omphalii]|uniref:LysE family translocator n=1 Tax=Tateyamaria omphalii TaxID=299262 RepID=UPI0019CAECE2|nr:LysE family translocator [Tateyamaria omphalii]GGX71006.1 threonine transporter RhtB [Tateyamaria omphalii]